MKTVIKQLSKLTGLISPKIKKAVISVNYRNNSIYESDNSCGLFYLLDEYLYNEIANHLPEKAVIKAKTFRAYSSFVISCPVDEAEKTTAILIKAIKEIEFDDDYFQKILDSTVMKAEKSKSSPFEICQSLLFDNKRLLTGISGNPDVLKRMTKSELLSVYNKFCSFDRLFFTIAVPNTSVYNKLSDIIHCDNKKCVIDPPAIQITNTKSFNGSFSCSAVSACYVAFPLNKDCDPLAAKMLCKILQDYLVSQSSDQSQYKKVFYCSQFGVKLLVFEIENTRINMKEFLSDVEQTINTNITKTAIRDATVKMVDSYKPLLTDPFDFTFFAVSNAMNNNEYHMQDFVDLKTTLLKMGANDIINIQKQLIMSDAFMVQIS